jgi:hypothetical protein
MAVDFATVTKLALALDGVTEATVYGAPGFKLRGKMVACTPTHRSAEPNSLAVSISFEQRELLVAEAPATYYVKEHYRNYPVVLVRLGQIDAGALGDLLAGACKFVRAKRST